MLEVYRVKDFRSLINTALVKEKNQADLMLRVLERIEVFEKGQLLVVFLDGTEIECK